MAIRARHTNPAPEWHGSGPTNGPQTIAKAPSYLHFRERGHAHLHATHTSRHLPTLVRRRAVTPRPWAATTTGLVRDGSAMAATPVTCTARGEQGARWVR